MFKFQGVFRILQLFEFRDWLAAIPETKLIVDPKTGNVEIGRKEIGKPTEPEVDSGVEKNSDEKHRMMQNMAQLWLQQEVSYQCLITYYLDTLIFLF